MTAPRGQPCSKCGASRSGLDAKWMKRGDGLFPVCSNCKTSTPRKPSPPRCSRRCGPDGLVGPACRFSDQHAGDCLPSGPRMPAIFLRALRDHGVPA